MDWVTFLNILLRMGEFLNQSEAYLCLRKKARQVKQNYLKYKQKVITKYVTLITKNFSKSVITQKSPC